MAAKGFIKLLEIAERSKQRAIGLPADGQAVEYWSGVGFTLNGRNYLAAMGEVSEVLAVPRYTHVPGVKPWMKGIANVRGRLLPITDLLTYFNGSSTLQEHRRRLVVIDQAEVFAGLVVDEVLGMQHFPVQDYVAEVPDVPAELHPFVQGAFRRGDIYWAVFSLSRLVGDPHFQQAANA
ncbi:MAG: type pili signal transduction protein PilI [Moraxellaceae bacterium]|jgi:twitching motility protein PilI|nr:type pili signal transduction protein PilI [Moraxellaceae bacterium]